MDLMFNSLPDVYSYQSIRHNTYDTPWLTDSSNKDTGKAVYPANKKSKEQCSDGKGSKDSCPICQERQRRPLATYIRSKSRQDRSEDSSIQEEAELPDETEKTQTSSK